MPQMMAAHDHPDPNAAQSMSLIGAGSWGMQNAAITCYGLFLYLAGRLGLATGKFAKWASYVAIIGGIFGILNIPFTFMGDAAGMVGFMIVPLSGILFNIVFAL